MPRVVITRGAKLRKELVFTDADIITIGRANTSDIVLPDPSRRVSRYQAAIVRAPGPQERYFLRDLSSLRPTKVRGEAVAQKLLQDGDVITIADYELVYFQTAVEAEEEEEVALIVVRKKEDDKAEQRGRDLTGKSTVLLTHQELLKEISLVPERREVVEALLSRARAVSALDDLFEALQEPILRVLSATRGFVGLFRDDHRGTYSGVGVRGFNPKKGERIHISDASFLERLQQGEYVQERTTLLVPLLLRDEAVGFFCLDRQPPADSFALEDIEFLSLLGRLATALIGIGTPARKIEQRAGDVDEVLEWPMAMVGKSPNMVEVYRQIAGTASTDGNVLLIGETGTGKELVAQAIHRQSSHSKGPFIQMNCGAIPETLAESEFFGYVARSGIAGADPSGAPGKFELANGGSLFLDEIEAMGLAIQAKCL